MKKKWKPKNWMRNEKRENFDMLNWFNIPRGCSTVWTQMGWICRFGYNGSCLTLSTTEVTSPSRLNFMMNFYRHPSCHYQWELIRCEWIMHTFAKKGDWCFIKLTFVGLILFFKIYFNIYRNLDSAIENTNVVEHVPI